MQQHFSIDVYGRVQGVGFRYATLTCANQYQIVGSVQNKDDGSVHIEAQGEAIALKKFVQTVKKGPNRFASVNRLEIEEQPVSTFSKFSIL